MRKTRIFTDHFFRFNPLSAKKRPKKALAFKGQ